MTQQKKIGRNNIDIILASKIAAVENGRRRMSSTRKNLSSIDKRSPKEFNVRPTVVVSKHPQDYASDERTDKEYAMSCAREVRKEHTYQDIEVPPYVTTIGKL